MLMGSGRYALVPDCAPSDDIVVVGLTLRDILMEATNQTLPSADMIFARLNSEHEADDLLQNVERFLSEKILQIAEKLASKPIIFMSFFEPSFNYLGDLIDPFAPTSAGRILREINIILSRTLRSNTNCYFLDSNEIINFIGRRYLHDDILANSSHASFINDWDFKLDANRLNAPKLIGNLFKYELAIREYVQVLISKVETIFNILARQSPIKLIIVDLDDTMWRGVSAEAEGLSLEHRIEGWPIGLAEALLFFKKRGGLLAICSKNDDQMTRERFNEIWRGAITFDDFASVKINWKPKSENIKEILKEVNLLPQSCLFIDDNDRELSEVKAGIPEIRCLGGNHYDWRRIILQSAETQVPTVTEESTRRTELVRAIAQREAEASTTMSREDWLISLGLRLNISLMADSKSKHFARVFELINKTNQFNTTGKRWEKAELEKFFSRGGLCIVTSLKDNLIDNGIISACLIEGDKIVQVVLSCRVFGLGAELVVGAVATRLVLKSHAWVRAEVIDTGRNATCHDYFERIGFKRSGDVFTATSPNTPPPYIKIENRNAADFPPVQV
jgi:FkbH-like protein